jgi:hypothetical protein
MSPHHWTVMHTLRILISYMLTLCRRITYRTSKYESETCFPENDSTRLHLPQLHTAHMIVESHRSWQDIVHTQEICLTRHGKRYLYSQQGLRCWRHFFSPMCRHPNLPLSAPLKCCESHQIPFVRRSAMADTSESSATPTSPVVSLL